jgi:hypothetical protein
MLRTLASIEAEFRGGGVWLLDTQMRERDAFRATFSFGGALANLDAAQVGNVKAAVANARALADEVVSILRAGASGRFVLQAKNCRRCRCGHATSPAITPPGVSA